MAAERTAPPPTTVSSASAAAATSAPSSSPSIDLVFSLQLDHKLVTSIRAGTATTRAHQLASSVAGSPAVGGVPNGAELVLVLYRREVFVDGRGQRRSAGADAMAAGAVAEEQTATSSLCTATLKDGFLPTDQWLWVELGRTEVTEMRVCGMRVTRRRSCTLTRLSNSDYTSLEKDSTHAAFIVPLAVTPLHSKTSGSDLRVEVHYLHEGSAVVTRPVAFVEFTEEQLLSGTRRRQSSGVVASSVDRSASETTEPLASVPKGTPRTRPDRPPSPIYDTRAGSEKTMSCSLFAVGNGTIFEGGAIVGELVVQMAEVYFWGHMLLRCVLSRMVRVPHNV